MNNQEIEKEIKELKEKVDNINKNVAKNVKKYFLEICSQFENVLEKVERGERWK